MDTVRIRKGILKYTVMIRMDAVKIKIDTVRMKKFSTW